MAATEEHAILHSQHLDLIYLQLGTLCDIIQNYPQPSTDPRKPTPGPHVDGVVGFVSHASLNQLVDQMVQMSLKWAYETSSQTGMVPTQTSEVNLVQFMQPKNP